MWAVLFWAGIHFSTSSVPSAIKNRYSSGTGKMPVLQEMVYKNEMIPNLMTCRDLCDLLH
jgi:hypothetical protein